MREELWTCEQCGTDCPVEQISGVGDIDLCPTCLAAWRAEFAACPHEWEPHDYEGEAGRYCRRCCGFVADEDFAELFGADERVAENNNKQDLWCCHVIGPDDIYAAESFEAAKAHADALNAAIGRYVARHPELTDIACTAVPAVWPWSPESHAEDLAKARAERAAEEERR